jgi:predicted RNA-binding protein YlqC (UPF0109 family)
MLLLLLLEGREPSTTIGIRWCRLNAARDRKSKVKEIPMNAPATVPKKTSIEELEAMLLTMTRGIVDSPGDVVVFPAPGDGFCHFEVRCDNSDAGTLIGTRGKHAEAIRTLMMAAGAVRKIRVTIQILGRDGNQYAPR